MEEVLEWMSQMEQAAQMYHLSDFDRTTLEFHRASMNDEQFKDEMTRWMTQDPLGSARWLRILERMRQVEWRRGQAWRAIYRMDQERGYLDRHLIRRER
jgi:predicted phosphoadenosine phosphosulfate sulfurtransferase